MQNIFCDAINKRLILELEYGGGMRQVEPYCYGINSQGKEVINAFQLSGHSQSAKPVGWKTFEINRISHIKLTTTTFTTINPEYNEKNPHFKRIYCKITLI